MNYYYFVAGAKDLILDVPKGTPPMMELLEELSPMLSKKDAKLLYLFRLNYDNNNFLTLLKNKDAIIINPLGNIPKDTWLEAIPNMIDTDPKSIYKEYGIDTYFTEFYQNIKNEELASKIMFQENYLSSLFFHYAFECSNEFVRDWFEYNLNLNNILTAIICKKNNWDVSENIIGKNDVAKTIRSNYTAKDLGLNGLYDDLDTIMAIREINSLVEQEKKIDAIKWNWLDGNTFFHDFSIEKIISYWLKCEILHRWDILNIENGKEIFKSILDDMKKIS